MSAGSSSPASSPRFSASIHASKPQHSCLECKRLKRACDKGAPCAKCAKANRVCEYKDPSDDGLFNPISSAKDVHSLAFGTLLDILVNESRVREAVSLYFSGVNTWFTIVERARFEHELGASRGHPSAEMSVLTLCMALVARPPNQKSSKGLGDAMYHSAKAILSLVQSKVPMSAQLLQTELLLAMYELSQSMPQQAYLSIGRCLQITKALGWHNKPAFWSPEENRMNTPQELKLYSILWWAIVYLDCLLHTGYQEQGYPIQTSDFTLLNVVPLPQHFDQHFYNVNLFSLLPGQDQGFRDANGDHIEGMAFPEATSAMYLRNVLQLLADPENTTVNAKTMLHLIGEHIKEITTARWRAGDRNAALGTDFIALMKLRQPGLIGGFGAIPDQNHTEAVRTMRVAVHMIHGKANKLLEADDRLNAGGIGPCWGFAMCYASQLLIAYGDGVFQDDSWFSNVTNLRGAIEKLSKRWTIAERYCEPVKIALDTHLTGFLG